jgi:hypothetical protein
VPEPEFLDNMSPTPSGEKARGKRACSTIATAHAREVLEIGDGTPRLES